MSPSNDPRPKMDIPSIKKETLPEKIIGVIRTMIDSGQLSPGSRLPGEREFAGMLGVGRQTLREALKALSILGIIVNRHGEGNFLSDDPNDWPMEPLSVFFSVKKGALLDLYEARKGIEMSSVSAAAERRTDEDIEKQRAALEAMRAAVDDYQLFYTLDFDFHRAIAAATGNPIIIDWTEKLYRLCQETQQILWDTADKYEVRPIDDLAGHEELLEHIINRDAEAASRCIAEHIGRVIERHKVGLIHGRD